MSRRDRPRDRTSDPLLEQDAWHTEQATETDHRHPARPAGGQVLARQLVGLAAAEAQHRAGLLHSEEVRGPVIDRNNEICSHNRTCLPKRDFVTLTPTTGEETTPTGRKRHNLFKGVQSPKRPGRSTSSAVDQQPHHANWGSHGAAHSATVWDMARNSHGLPVEPVIDLVADRLSDAEIAARFVEWLGDLDGVPVVVPRVSALDELRSAYAADDV